MSTSSGKPHKTIDSVPALAMLTCWTCNDMMTMKLPILQSADKN